MSALWIAPRLGWRNLWRNPRRSLITLAAIAAAFAFLIGLIGLMEGLKDQLLRNGTRLQLGDFQIHHGAYLPDRNINDTIGGDEGLDLQEMLARVSAQPEVEGLSPRVYGFGLLSTGSYSSGAQILGVDPAAELSVTTLLRGLRQGSIYPTSGSRGLILGQALAEEIHAQMGTEVAVVTQAADGTLGNDLFHVVGILRTGLTYQDRSLAVTCRSDLQELLALAPGRVHEVAGRIRDPLSADKVCARVNNSGVLPAHAQARGWGELSPQLKDYVRLSESTNGFMIFLVALFAAFGVLNTTMMAVFERTREIGMLGSLGMRPVLILLTFLLESLYLALLGLAAGFGVGALMMSYLTLHGWDLSRWVGEVSMLGTRMDPVLKGAWAWDQVFWAAAGLTAATLLAAFMPARRVAWMQPVTALTAPTEG
jgi:ABC-type lipoprotein release transport system permease subunit